MPRRTDFYLEASRVLSNFDHEELYSKFDLKLEYHTLEIMAWMTIVYVITLSPVVRNKISFSK